MFIRPLITAIALLGAAATAQAQAAEPTSAAVQTDDLNLADAADRDRLETRLTNAARNICHTGMQGVAARLTELRCVKSALASTRLQVNLAMTRAGQPVQIALLTTDAFR